MKDAKRFDDVISRAKDGGVRPEALFSSPGRIEIGGNHTDHQQGKVLAAAIDLDTVAAAAPRADGTINISSEGYEPFSLDIDGPFDRARFAGTPMAITAGLVRAFREAGHEPGGFDAFVSSSVEVGSGVSSSSSFELLIATVIDHFYCGGAVSPAELAFFAKYAENEFFGKPSGMMDQLACAVGGINAIDFADPERPSVEPVAFDFEAAGFSVFIVSSGADHADMTGLYASIPEDMGTVAAYFGSERLRQVDENAFYSAIPALRRALGDRPVLRAMHFFDENRRVERMYAALKENNICDFLNEVTASGLSSWTYLQNVIPPGDKQALAVALAVIDRQLKGRGAVRVHGGGFAGTALAFVPCEASEDFAARTDGILGEGSCRRVRVRDKGAFGFDI